MKCRFRVCAFDYVSFNKWSAKDYFLLQCRESAKCFQPSQFHRLVSSKRIYRSGLCRTEGHTRSSALSPMRQNVPNDSNNALTEADYASDVDTKQKKSGANSI
jgi:hypothetical protein